MRLVADPDARVAIAAIHALGSTGACATNTVGFLVGLATNRTHGLRDVAIEALGALGPAANRAAPALAALLNEQSSPLSDPVSRSTAARVGTSGLAIGSCKWEVRQLAEQRAPSPQIVPNSPETSGDPRLEVGPLSHFGEDTLSVPMSSRQHWSLVPPRPSAPSTSPQGAPDASEIRSLAAEALAKIGATPSEITSQLRQVPGSEGDTTRAALAVAVWQSNRDDPARQAMVIEALRSGDWGVRLRATRLLSDLGTNAVVFLPELRRLLLDPESVVRFCATTAVRRVSPPEP
jgi:hypothetical protein